MNVTAQRTATAIALSWGQLPDGDWVAVVKWRPLSASAWQQTLASTSAQHTITGLDATRDYEWQVIALGGDATGVCNGTAPHVTRKFVLGINNGLGWGGPSASKLLAANLGNVRADYEHTSESPANLLANGLTPAIVVIGNTPDQTPLADVDLNTWLQNTIAQADDAVHHCGPAVLFEVGNEMYQKGGNAGGVVNPRKYAQMFGALASARPAYSFLFCSFGDYQLANGSWSQIAAGRGWLGDALAAVPALKTQIAGFISHPYGRLKPTLANSGNAWGPGAMIAQHDQAVKLGFTHADQWWLTEYGSSYPLAADGDLQEVDAQAMLDLCASLPWVRGLFWFATRDYDGMNPPASGIFNGDWTPRPIVGVLSRRAALAAAA